MRSTTAGELTTLAAASRVVTSRVKVANGSGTMADLSSWVESIDWDHDADIPVSGCTITFTRALGTIQSLAPFRTDSTLNRLDDAVTYSPQLDLTRAITIEVATTAIGATIVAGDYKKLFEGTISINGSAKSPVEVTGRDLGGQLVDEWLQSEHSYGSLPGEDLEDVMQELLDDWTTGTTLYVPASPSYVISPEYLNQRQSVMDALLALAQLPGWDIRYKWDDGTSSFRLTLYSIDRTKTVPDYTFGSSGYLDVTKLDIELTDIRNYIILSYPQVGGVRTTASDLDATSVIRYGGPSSRPRFLYIQEADSSPINTAPEAATLLAAALADLKDPKADAEIELPFFWPVELGDLLRFSANGVHFDTDQDLAVVSIKHSLSRNRHRTQLRLRGKPASGYLNWQQRDEIAWGESEWTEGTPRRDRPYDDGEYALGATEPDGTTTSSTKFAPQGSIIPTPLDNTLLSYSAGGPGVGDMWLSWSWSGFTIYLPDNTTIAVGASSTLPVPAAPTLSQVAGGALAGRTRFVRIAYVKNTMIYPVGAEASFVLSANNLLKVTSPAAVDGYDGWRPLVGATADTEFTQPATFIAFGTDWTEPVGGADISTSTPYNAAWLLAVTMNLLNPSTTYYFYPFWDIVAAVLAFTDSPLTSKTALKAQQQNRDGRIALSVGGVQGITPAGGVGGSGSGGGGKLL